MNRFMRAMAVYAALGSVGRCDETDGRLLQLSIEELLNVRVVSGSRREQKQIESPRSMSVITGDEIRRRNYRTIPDALNSLTGVMTQYTNYGGGSPMIRGLIGNRILILIDGVRLNNAIFRLGPNQYLNTIDINRVERIEVVRGPGSVLYGSDALGGLINIITRRPPTGSGASELHAGLYARLSSQDRGISTRAQIEGGIGKVALTGGVSLKRFGDLRAGGVTGRQLNTGYDEAAGDVKLTYAIAPNRELTFSAEQLQQEDVRRTDVIRAGTDRRYDWDPLSRQMFLLQYKQGKTGPFIDEWLLAITAQHSEENINRIAASKPTALRRQDDQVRTQGVVLQANSRLGARQVFTYGLDFYRDRVGSTRRDLNLLTGVSTIEKSTFADDSHFRSLAGFVQDEIQLNPGLSLNLRTRYSRFHLGATTTDIATGAVRIESDPSAWTSGAYVSQRLKPGLFLVGGVGQAFRAPNVDDSTIVGTFASGLEVPNPQLRPERAINYETGLKMQGKRFTGSASVYLSRFRDLIDRAPGLYRGLSFLDGNGNGVKDKAEDAIFQRMNVGQARISGIELEGFVPLTSSWSAWANASWIRGVDTVKDAPLTRIPPAKGELGLRWQGPRGLWVEPWVFYAGRQDRLSSADRSDPRISPTGTPGFFLSGIRAGLRLGELGVFTVNAGNLANRVYRQHGSGIDGPGRGVDIGLSRTF